MSQRDFGAVLARWKVDGFRRGYQLSIDRSQAVEDLFLASKSSSMDCNEGDLGYATLYLPDNRSIGTLPYSLPQRLGQLQYLVINVYQYRLPQ